MKSTCKFGFYRENTFLLFVLFYDFVTEKIFELISLYPQVQVFFLESESSVFLPEKFERRFTCIRQRRLHNRGDFVGGELISETNDSILHCVYP